MSCFSLRGRANTQDTHRQAATATSAQIRTLPENDSALCHAGQQSPELPVNPRGQGGVDGRKREAKTKAKRSQRTRKQKTN